MRLHVGIAAGVHILVEWLLNKCSMDASGGGGNGHTPQPLVWLTAPGRVEFYTYLGTYSTQHGMCARQLDSLVAGHSAPPHCYSK